MYAEALVFLRFGCYVHNPDAVYARATQPIIKWLDSINAQDSEWGYTSLTANLTNRTVICIGVPTTLHQALCDLDADYTYTSLNPAAIHAIISAKKNSIRLTQSNIRTYLRITKTSPSYFVTVVESYLSRIESNPVQPLYREEIETLQKLGIDPKMISRLPRVEDFGFDPIYITDEHHRLKCL